MSWIDRLIAWLSPAWAWRRKQWREALADLHEETPPDWRRRDADAGWIGIDDPANPLNPANLGAIQEGHEERRRGWLV